MSLLSHSHRPHLAHGDSFRSLPVSPYALEATRGLTTRDVEDAIHQSRLDLGPGPVGDYFAATTPRYASSCGGGGGTSLRGCSPFAPDLDLTYGGVPGGIRGGSGGSGLHELALQEVVRRTNLAAALANGQIRPRASYAQLHPMMTPDGRYPADFSLARTLDSFRSLESTALDRILAAYRLPLDLRGVLGKAATRGGAGPSAGDARVAKVLVLYEYLGAVRLLEYERLRRSFY